VMDTGPQARGPDRPGSAPNVLAIRREFEIRFGRFLDADGPTFPHYRISI